MNIKIEQLTSYYNESSPFEHQALSRISTTFQSGLFYAIIGHTGSGKSTLVQHLNGLIIPSNGNVYLDDILINRKVKHKVLNHIKSKVGIVFQFPEYQLFEETVIKDVMFGPLNMGVEPKLAREKAEYFLKRLGIDEQYFQTSPFELSGGQMRKVAISGILAMEPEVLIIDEPTAGLDPKSHEETMELFQSIHNEHNMTTILVTHNMNDVYQYTDAVKVLNDGQLVAEGRTEDLLTDSNLLTQYHLEVPYLVRLTNDLKQKGIPFDYYPKTLNEFIHQYERWRAHE